MRKTSKPLRVIRKRVRRSCFCQFRCNLLPLFDTFVCVLLCSILSGSALCLKSEFWNRDVAQCVPCQICKQYPKTPSCDTCPPIEPSDSWRVAAITSLSVLAAVIVCGALLIGILVHQFRSKRTLREPIEETTGPLYQV